MRELRFGQLANCTDGAKTLDVCRPMRRSVDLSQLAGDGRAAQFLPKHREGLDHQVVIHKLRMGTFGVLMDVLMRGWRKANQVLKAVVVRDAVLVVDVMPLRGRSVSSFPNNAVFRLVPALDTNQYVPLSIINSPAFPARMIFASDADAVVIVDEAARVSSPDASLLIGESDESCFAATAALTNARRRNPFRRRHVLEAFAKTAVRLRLGVMPTDESRIAILARREGHGVAAPTLA